MMTTAEVVEHRAEARASAGGRLALLDVLRGVAILGTLATNVWIFTNPLSEMVALTNAASISAVDGLSASPAAAVVEGTFRFVANGKFLALLTVLFGVGLAIQHRSAESRGRPWLRSYLWRPVLLFAEGTLHFLLVFAYDVLMGYAIVAVLVAVLLRRSARTQRITMYVAGACHVVLMALITVALLLAPRGDAGPALRDTLFTHGSYLDQVAFRVDNMLALRAEPIVAFGLLLFLFLLGVHLFRAGTFGADERGRTLRRRLLWVGLGLGLPLSLTSTLVGPELFMLERYVFAPLVALGYVGLVGWIVDRVRVDNPAVTALSAVGRTALSGYVLQNVLCVVVAYGWGLGLATAFDGARPWWVLALWTVVSVALVALARLWLRWLGQGPLEALQKRALRRLPGSRG